MKDQNYYGYIYITLDQKHNKVYVGQKKGLIEKSLNYFGSGRIIKDIIKYRGTYFLTKIILGVCYSDIELSNSEIESINFFDARNPIYGYNIHKGGNITEEEKQKISLKTKHKVVSKETKLKMSESAMIKKFSKTHRLNLSIAGKGKKKPSGFGEKISKIKKGFRHSDFSKMLMSVSQKENYTTNPNFGMTNKNHTEESKTLISINHRDCKGENNPNFGKGDYKIWVEKYGIEEADRRLEIKKEKLSISGKGRVCSQEHRLLLSHNQIINQVQVGDKHKGYKKLNYKLLIELYFKPVDIDEMLKVYKDTFDSSAVVNTFNRLFVILGFPRNGWKYLKIKNRHLKFVEENKHKIDWYIENIEKLEEEWYEERHKKRHPDFYCKN